MLELAVASSAPAGGDEPARRRLVRDFLASKACDLGCVEVPRADYEVAAARHPEWARAQEGWALDDDMLELPISRLENGKFRVEPERSFLMAQMITWTFQRLALVRHARLMCGYFLSQRQEIIQL